MMLLGLEKLNEGTPYFLCFHERFWGNYDLILAELQPFYWVTKLIELMVLLALIEEFMSVFNSRMGPKAKFLFF